ncbi:MAG: helicase, RecD/TraA family [Firmicutes bacterium]|nr:helicase, RecD/TraA family [Bacillota bacterium]
MESCLVGTVDSIVFQNKDGSFVVFRLRPAKESTIVTVVGDIPKPLVGEELELIGEWVEHSRFGRQFKILNVKRVPPSDIKGIERFLASGAITGIGPAMAARLVAYFGTRTLEAMEFYPHRLTEVAGIGTKKAEIIRRSFAEHSEMRDLMLFLETYGVSGAYAGKIYAYYGAASLTVLNEDPYRLAQEVQGIGFRIADHIAQAIGWERNHPARLAAGVRFALLQTAKGGHCCLPDELLVTETAKLLGADRLEVASCLNGMIKDNALYTDDFCGTTLVYPSYLYHAEKMVAERLKFLKQHAKPVSTLDPWPAVERWEENAGVEMAEAQRQAIAGALLDGVLVLTGGPGTGKTVTVKGMLSVLAEQGFKILLGAPTGRAAKRLGEAAGYEAATIHRLLESSGGVEGAPLFMRNEENPLEADVIIIDEASMMDIILMAYLLKAVPDGCRVILVGDVDQLPAVGPGAVLKDIIRSAIIPVIRLTEVFRQAGESMIVVNAHRINQGRMPDYSSSIDFQFREINDAKAVEEEIVKLCREELATEGFDIFHEVQVLSPMHRQFCGVESLNKVLQAALNPSDENKFEAAGTNQVFREGDKVMQVRNNYTKGVFNGDIGRIIRTDSSQVVVRYSESDVAYQRNEFDEISLAYCMSVHKSQGSEYRVVIMPLVRAHNVMLQRNLLYTAVTRAKEKVFLLGSKAALNTALANDRTRRRYSLLTERLRGEDL